jgi:hypothetical protein
VKKTVQDNKMTTNKGVKCFNCNKHAGHIARDCPEPKKDKITSTKETGMFVGCCMFINEDEVNEDEKEINETDINEYKNNKRERKRVHVCRYL